MLSYQKWKKLNENFGFTLGLGQPNKIADIQSRWNEMGMPPMKMMKKKMFGGDDGPDMDAEGEKSSGDTPPFMKKGKKPLGKKSPFGKKPDMDHDDDDMGDDIGHDDDMGDMGGDDDMDHDEDDMGDDISHDDDDMGGEEDMGDDMGGDGDMGVGGPAGGDLPVPPIKKGKGILNKTRAVADGAKMMHKGASKMIKGMKEAAVEDHVDDDDEGPVKKMGNQVMQSKKAKKMTKEDVEFFRSLQAQTGGTMFEKDVDGDWVPVQEDAIIPPSDPNAGIEEDDEPGPGEVGYAPQGRVGSIGSFSEWSNKYKKGKKINESSKANNKSWFGQ